MGDASHLMLTGTSDSDLRRAKVQKIQGNKAKGSRYRTKGNYQTFADLRIEPTPAAKTINLGFKVWDKENARDLEAQPVEQGTALPLKRNPLHQRDPPSPPVLGIEVQDSLWCLLSW